MTYQRFKLPAQTVAKLASVAGVHAHADVRRTAQENLACARFPPTLKSKLVSYNQAISTSYAHISKLSREEPGISVFACDAATLAAVATLRAPGYSVALAAFKQARPYGATRVHHDQACWAAEMFLMEWSSLAAEFEWTADDIFAPPHGSSSGLACWLGVDIVTALGPEHASTETNRVFDRITRQTWINPYSNQEPVH